MMFSEVILKIQKLKKYAYCSGEKMGKNNYCNDDNTKVHDTKVKRKIVWRAMKFGKHLPNKIYLFFVFTRTNKLENIKIQERTSLVSYYQFCTIMDIQTFRLKTAAEMSLWYFQSQHMLLLNYQIGTVWHFPPQRTSSK